MSHHPSGLMLCICCRHTKVRKAGRLLRDGGQLLPHPPATPATGRMQYVRASATLPGLGYGRPRHYLTIAPTVSMHDITWTDAVQTRQSCGVLLMCNHGHCCLAGMGISEGKITLYTVAAGEDVCTANSVSGMHAHGHKGWGASG